MASVAVALLATPLFGFALQIQSAAAPPGSEAPAGSGARIAAQIALVQAAPDGAAAAQDDSARYALDTKRRNSIAKVHRELGIATWVAMTSAVVLGTIQYYNLYGVFADAGSNPCVKGHAVFGQGQCTGTPWPHLAAASVTTAFYAATFTLSLLMPDPDDLAHAKGEFASRVRLHKVLRWVHFSGMIAQLVLGGIIANNIGLDRANNYGTLQALATVHLATGLVTYGALTWAGALMTF